MSAPFRHRREPRECQVCGSPYSGRGKFFCSRKCAGNTKHGLTETVEYKAWTALRERCRNPRCDKYHLYGARGIAVCERWDVYENFIADMGPRPTPQHSIERIDNNRGYEPSNCKWGTKLEQSRNRSISWTPEQDAQLRDCLERGYTYKSAAEALGKSEQGTIARAGRIGVKSRRTSGGRLLPLPLSPHNRQQEDNA